MQFTMHINLTCELQPGDDGVFQTGVQFLAVLKMRSATTGSKVLEILSLCTILSDILLYKVIENDR